MSPDLKILVALDGEVDRGTPARAGVAHCDGEPKRRSAISLVDERARPRPHRADAGRAARGGRRHRDSENAQTAARAAAGREPV